MRTLSSLLSLCLLAPCAWLHCQTGILPAVTFTGAPEYSQAELLAFSGLKPGKSSSQQQMDDAAQRLSYTGLFDEAIGTPRVPRGKLNATWQQTAPNWTRIGSKIMRSIFAYSIAALVALFTLSSPLRAQVKAGSGDVSGNVGFSNLSGSETEDGNKHVAFGGAVSYNSPTTDWASLGFEYSYQMLGSATQSGVTESGHIQSYGGVFRAYLTKSNRVAPYALLAGGGQSDTEAATSGGLKVTASQSGYYIGFGGGASIYAGPSWGVRPELRYERQQFSATTVDSFPVAAYGQNYILGTISVFCQFGGKSKM